MVNVAVFNLKDLAKYLLKFAFVILIFAVVVKFTDYMKQSSYTKSLNSTIPLLAYLEGAENLDEQIEEKLDEVSWPQRILNTHLALKNNIVKNNKEIRCIS